jgi:hypothetical protein
MDRRPQERRLADARLPANHKRNALLLYGIQLVVEKTYLELAAKKPWTWIQHRDHFHAFSLRTSPGPRTTPVERSSSRGAAGVASLWRVVVGGIKAAATTRRRGDGSAARVRMAVRHAEVPKVADLSHAVDLTLLINLSRATEVTQRAETHY